MGVGKGLGCMWLGARFSVLALSYAFVEEMRDAGSR